MYVFPSAGFCPPCGLGFECVVASSEGDGGDVRGGEELAVVAEFGFKDGWEGANGAERSSGYVWKNSGAKVVPKNAPKSPGIRTSLGNHPNAPSTL
jgi:hypothetical protein